MYARHPPNRLVSLIVTIALAGCSSAAVPPAGPGAAPPATVAPPASQPTSKAPPPAPPLPDEYEGCPRVRRTGAGGLDAHERAEARASTWMWPAPCGQVSGWAGISIAMSTQAVAFSRDGARLLACGVSSPERVRGRGSRARRGRGARRLALAQRARRHAGDRDRPREGSPPAPRCARAAGLAPFPRRPARVVEGGPGGSRARDHPRRARDGRRTGGGPLPRRVRYERGAHRPRRSHGRARRRALRGARLHRAGRLGVPESRW